MVNQYTKDPAPLPPDHEEGALIRRSCMPMPDVTDPTGVIVGELFVDTAERHLLKIGIRDKSGKPHFPINVYYVNGRPCLSIASRGKVHRIDITDV